jgi:predicted RNase H-like nuclease (RuvC/YqgF family)
MNEDLAEGRAFSSKNREEIIKLQIRYSQLMSQDERLKGEHTTLHDENEFYLKKNAEFELENAKLNKEIQQTIMKIDINALLKEVDIEDLKLQAQTNKMMNATLHQLLSKWENINKIDEDAPK